MKIVFSTFFVFIVRGLKCDAQQPFQGDVQLTADFKTPSIQSPLSIENAVNAVRQAVEGGQVLSNAVPLQNENQTQTPTFAEAQIPGQSSQMMQEGQQLPLQQSQLPQQVPSQQQAPFQQQAPLPSQTQFQQAQPQLMSPPQQFPSQGTQLQQQPQVLPNSQTNPTGSSNQTYPGQFNNMMQYPPPSQMAGPMQQSPYLPNSSGYTGMNSQAPGLNLYSPEAQATFMLSANQLSEMLNDPNRREIFLTYLYLLRDPNAISVFSRMKEIMNDPQLYNEFMNQYRPGAHHGNLNQPTNSFSQIFQPGRGLMGLLKPKLDAVGTLIKEEGAAKIKAANSILGDIPFVGGLVKMGTDIAGEGLKVVDNTWRPFTGMLPGASGNIPSTNQYPVNGRPTAYSQEGMISSPGTYSYQGVIPNQGPYQQGALPGTYSYQGMIPSQGPYQQNAYQQGPYPQRGRV